MQQTFLPMFPRVVHRYCRSCMIASGIQGQAYCPVSKLPLQDQVLKGCPKKYFGSKELSIFEPVLTQQSTGSQKQFDRGCC